MRYAVTFARNQDIDNIQHETVNTKDEQDARSMFTVCDCYVYSVEIVLPPDRDDAAILQAARAIFPNAVFVETEMSLIDRVHMVHGEAQEPDWMTEARAQMADAKDLERTQEDARL